MSDYIWLWIYTFCKFGICIIALYVMYKLGENAGKRSKHKVVVIRRVSSGASQCLNHRSLTNGRNVPRKKQNVTVKGAFADMASVWE